MLQKKDKNIECKLLYTVQSVEGEDGKRMVAIRCVDWIIDGKKHYPQLEKRDFYRDQEGEWKMGKAKGFNLKDLETIQEKWNAIMQALGSRLPEHQTETKEPSGYKGSAMGQTQVAAKQADF